MDFEEFCAAAKSEHQLEAMESREKHQCMHMSCLRRMANSGSCLKELAFVFSSAYLLLASHDYFVAILILGKFFSRILVSFQLKYLEVLLVFLASRDMNKNEESLLMSVCAAISDNAIGKEFERLALKNRNFGLIL